MVAIISSLTLLLAAEVGAADPAGTPASLAEIGEVLSTAQMCEAFDYRADWQGLGGWAATQRDAMVAADPALTSVAAQAEIERKISAHAKSIYAVYWEGAVRGARSEAAIEKQYRFVKLFRKKCDHLARAPEVGQFVTAPEQDPGASQIIARITARFEQARAS